MQLIGRLNKYFIILILIVILAGVLRLPWLTKYPVGFTPDEASFGYDAYSIIKTGKDQWGHTLPIVLESFGDFKAPLFSYLLIPAVGIGGLNVESVRLTNAIFGTLAVLVVYFLAKKLVGKPTALAASFLLAISSWHIMMSRGGFEANLTTFFLPLGLFLLLVGLKKNFYLYLGTLILGLNLFSYHAAKIVTPLTVILFIYFFRNELFKVKKAALAISAGIFLFFFGLMIYSFTLGAGARVNDVSILNGIEGASADYKIDATKGGVSPIIARILYTKYEVPVTRFLDNYTSYFSPQFLFTKGPAEATYGMIPGRGMLYWFELPLLFGFLVFLIKAKNKSVYLFLLSWLLVAPIPAALSTGPGAAGNRAESMIPVLQIILAVGFVGIFGYLRNTLHGFSFRVLTAGYIVFSLVIFSGFLADYFLISRVRNAPAMLSGNLEVAGFLGSLPKDSKIVVSKSLSEPQIYIAFANKWDPKDLQNATKSWNYQSLGVNWVDQIPEYKIGNYTFKGINLIDFRGKPETYIVAKPGEFPNGTKSIKTIYYPDNTPAVLVVKSSDLIFPKL